jgi:hypothetical protein
MKFGATKEYFTKHTKITRIYNELQLFTMLFTKVIINAEEQGLIEIYLKVVLSKVGYLAHVQ